MSPFNWRDAPSQTADSQQRQHAARAVSTRNVEQARAEGKDRSTIHGLSRKPHGGVYSRAIVSKVAQ